MNFKQVACCEYPGNGKTYTMSSKDLLLLFFPEYSMKINLIFMFGLSASLRGFCRVSEFMVIRDMEY